jgi:hypothetical protein
MENLTEDSSFQAGYRVAKYLKENPCDQPECAGENCAECIAYAVEMIEYEMEAERRNKLKQTPSV